MTKPKIEVLPIEKAATPDSSNINKHTQKGGGLLENSLRKRGAFRSIASVGKGVDVPVVMAGNYTLEKAIDAGFTEVINVHVTGNQLVNVVRDDLAPNSPEAIALGIEDNEIGKQSYNPDIDILATVMADPAMQTLKDEDKVLAGLVEGMGYKDNEPVDAEPQIDRASELLEKWQVKTGDLWQVGEHRILCGDSTKEESYAVLFNDKLASITFTSPPYNAGDSAKLRGNTSIGDNFYKNEYLDNKSQPEYLNLLNEFTKISLLYSQYVFCNIQVLAGNKFAFIDYLYQNKDIFCDVAIWRKRQAQPAAAKRVMDSIFEFVLVFGGNGSRAIGTKDFRGMVRNVIEGDAQHENDFSDIHAATMPLYLPQYFISNFTNESEVVLEPFNGSGTTMLACQNLNRKCRAIEISPAYVAVTLERMSQAFPELEIKKL